MLLKLLVSAFCVFGQAACSSECSSRKYTSDSFVCVCNETFCDFLQPHEPIKKQNAEAVIYRSSRSGDRFKKSAIQLKKVSNTISAAEKVTFNFSETYQKIDGFGGAFTDAAGINIASLPTGAQENLIRSYFSPEGGIKYNIGRIPIASCDFSTSNYSYNDKHNDFDMENFALAPEDQSFKIPFILKALNVSSGILKLFGSPWSSPHWMKTSGMMQGFGTLIGQPGGPYYKSFAKYLIKFIEEYEKRGIKIWALTVENEPSAGFVYNYEFQALGFTAETERDFIKLDLGPALEASGHSQVKLMILDDKRIQLPDWAQVVLSDENAARYVSHIALHWYNNKITPIKVLDLVHDLFPNVPFIGTEACVGIRKDNVILGSWSRAEDYAWDIITNLNHWYTGWLDWNLALDLKGGPNWVGNFVDSPIIVNSSSGEFYKQPMFYAMGHFSTFLPRNSVRAKILTHQTNPDLFVTGFLTPENQKVVVALNKGESDALLSIRDVAYDDKRLSIQLENHSLATILWA